MSLTRRGSRPRLRSDLGPHSRGVRTRALAGQSRRRRCGRLPLPACRFGSRSSPPGPRHHRRRPRPSAGARLQHHRPAPLTAARRRRPFGPPAHVPKENAVTTTLRQAARKSAVAALSSVIGAGLLTAATVATAPAAQAATTCSGTASIYGILPDGRLTFSTITPTTGELKKVRIGADLGFEPKAMATLNFNTVLVTSTKPARSIASTFSPTTSPSSWSARPSRSSTAAGPTTSSPMTDTGICTARRAAPCSSTWSRSPSRPDRRTSVSARRSAAASS